jgi:integrase
MDKMGNRHSFPSQSTAHARLRTPVQPFSAEQLRHLLKTTEDNSTRVLLLIAGTTGMRISEILALTWPDIDVVQQVILVSHALHFQHNQLPIVTAPKRAIDRRTVILTPKAATALKEHHAYQNNLNRQRGVHEQEQEWVFCTSSGTPLYASKVSTNYQALLLKAGLPERPFHELRYSAARILLDLGTHPDVVRAILGMRQQHSGIIAPLSSDVLPGLIRVAILQFNHALQR